MPVATSVSLAPAVDSPIASEGADPVCPVANAAPMAGVWWWGPQWQMQQALQQSYWQTWQRLAWMPWNLVLSAWQVADTTGVAPVSAAPGMLQGALGSAKPPVHPSTHT